MKIANEKEMLDFGARLGRELTRDHRFEIQKNPNATASEIVNDTSKNLRAIVFELVGDVGAGKTTLVRGLAKGLGAKELVTSPSFTISRAYALPRGRRLIHYDFYRLGDPGLMAEDLAENLSDQNNIVVIEWGESIQDILPENHTKIEILYNDDNSREVIMRNLGDETANDKMNSAADKISSESNKGERQ